MSKKKFNETKVGKFLSKTAPGILDLAGNVLPDAGVFGLLGLVKKFNTQRSCATARRIKKKH